MNVKVAELLNMNEILLLIMGEASHCQVIKMDAKYPQAGHSNGVLTHFYHFRRVLRKNGAGSSREAISQFSELPPQKSVFS